MDQQAKGPGTRSRRTLIIARCVTNAIKTKAAGKQTEIQECSCNMDVRMGHEGKYHINPSHRFPPLPSN
jgi:hypothetical protein